jgi:hypothetical protein
MHSLRLARKRDSSVRIVCGLRAGRPGSVYRQGQWWDFLLRQRVHTGSGSHLAPNPMDTGGKAAGAWSWPLYLHLLPVWIMRVSLIPLPQHVFMAWCLFKHRDSFTFTFTLREGCGIAQWYSAELRAGWSGVRVLAGAGNFSLHHRVQTGSGANPISYPMGSRVSLPRDKAAGAWSCSLTSI